MEAMGDVPVTLIIKAPTQQVNDQTIQCARSWTVERLKRHIADVYPNNPRPSDQRLIYYGQLLSDSETLQEVLTRFEEGETVHTVHLVCMPTRENMGRVPPSPPVVPPTPHQPPTPHDAYRFYMNPAGYEPWMNEANSGYFQQLAWAQQAYANYYFSQYMDMMAREQGAHHAQGMYAAPGGGEGGDDIVGRAAGEEAAAAPQRLIDDDDRQRDWLDYVYTMARMVVLFSIVYFYSSPARFLIVSLLGCVIYMYQMGFFRLHNMPLPNNNEMLNNNLPQDNNNLAHAQADDAAEAEGESAAPPPVDAAAAPPPPPPSLLALSWTFFTSLIASLIPDNVNAV